MFTKEDIEFKFNKNSWGYDKIRDIVGEQTDIFSIIMNCKNQFLDSSRDGNVSPCMTGLQKRVELSNNRHSNFKPS